MSNVIDFLDRVKGSGLARGVVTRHDPEGRTIVMLEDAGPESDEIPCEHLWTTNAEPPTLAAGDEVLVWGAQTPARAGIILGRIGAADTKGPRETNQEEPSKELVISAGQMISIS